MPNLYSTGIHRVAYKAENFATGKSVSAYFWSPSLVKSSLQTFIEIEMGAYYLDYDFEEAGAYLCITFENDLPKGFAVYRIEEAPIGSGLTAAQNTALMLIKDISEGDMIIDKTAIPWQLVIKKKGTDTELIRKDLKDVNGNDITSITTVIGRQMEP